MAKEILPAKKSRKNFSVKFIIAAEKGGTVPSGFIDHIKKYMEVLPAAWNRLTDGKSNMAFAETPEIVFDKAEIDFGKVADGTVKTSILKISNGSSSPLIIDSIYTSSTMFTVNSDKFTLKNSDTLRLNVTFTADSAKSYSDTLYIISNSNLLYTTIGLKGQSEIPLIALDKKNIDFNHVDVNSISKDSLTLTNNSSALLIIDSVYTRTKWFNVRIDKDSVSNKDTLKLYIFFTPDTIRSYLDTLYILSNSDVPFTKIVLMGNAELSGILENKSGIPEKFEISQNYPNPFNPITTINYVLPIDSRVKLKVFDVLGNEVTVLINTHQTAGYYSFVFNAADLPSGVYLYRLETESYINTKKLILLK